jgi:Spy/CpxP family protein refolding chaperone
MLGTNTKRYAGLWGVALAVALGVALVAAAQPGPMAGPGRGHGPFIRALRGGLATLGLTDEQKTKVKAVLASRKDAGLALRQKMRADATALHDLAGATNPDPAAVGAAFLKVKANREEARSMAVGVIADVKTVLTPEQQTKLDGYLAALKQFRRVRTGRG